MRLLASYGSGAVAVFQRDAAMFLSYRMRLITQIFSLAFSVTLFYYISRLVAIEQFSTPDAYFAFVVIGMVIMQIVTSTLLMLPSALRQELVAATFERILLSPFGPVAGVVSMTVFPFLRSLVMASVMLAFATLTFGLELKWPSILLAVPAAFLGALAFTPFSLLFAAIVVAFKQSPGTGFVLAGISLMAGIYFPVELLPNWVQWTSEVQPFTPAVELMRHLIVGHALEGSPWLNVLKLFGFAAVLLPITAFALATAVRFGQRRGTIIEY